MSYDATALEGYTDTVRNDGTSSNGKKRPLSFEDKMRLQILAAAVAAAGPAKRVGEKCGVGSGICTASSSPESSDPAPSPANDSKMSEGVEPQAADPITGSIDSVDVSARMAMLDALKADMEHNFMKMKRAYGGPPPSRKKQQAAPQEGAGTTDMNSEGSNKTSKPLSFEAEKRLQMIASAAASAAEPLSTTLKHSEPRDSDDAVAVEQPPPPDPEG
jgi:hypothetical protein